MSNARCACARFALRHAEFDARQFPVTNAPRTITYRFQPEVTPDGLVLHISLEFETGTSGMETLELPTEWAGELLHPVFNLHAVSTGASLIEGSSADMMILHASAGRAVVIAYDLKKDWSGPLVNPKQFHPVLMPQYFEFTGDSALVHLKFDSDATETANFDWQKLPDAWALATSFGTSTSTTDRCQTYSGPWIDVVHGLYAGGDYRIHRFLVGRRAAVLVVRGSWTFTDDEAVEQLRKVIGMVRDFWRDNNSPYFLITLNPYDRDHGSSDGGAFTNAFWMYLSRLDSFAGLLWQLAHEAFHTWNPTRMGALSNEADRATVWFKEGFTSYYGYLLVYRSAALAPQNYIDSLNRDLRKFPASSDPYVRGRVIALWLDGAIRRESRGEHSLDDMMFDMVRTRDKPITLLRILETAGVIFPLTRAISCDEVWSITKAWRHPTRYPPLSVALIHTFKTLPPSTSVSMLSARRKRARSPGWSKAAQHLRRGYATVNHLASVSVNKGDPDRLARFTIHADAGDRQITLNPRGRTVPTWQYRLDSSGTCERVP
jgi:predicted metalloprotease with PDZ domain